MIHLPPSVRSQSAFTMVEMLVALLLTAIVMGAIYSVYRVQTRSVKAQENRLEAQEYARAVLDMMVREIRNVGYFPVVACAAPVNTSGIVTASNQTFRFIYDADGTGSCTENDEDIEYRFDATGCSGGLGNIKRKTVQPANDLPMTDCNVSGMQFLYYPQQTSAAIPPPFCFSAGNPSGCSLDLAANLANVQRVSVSLTVQSKNPDQYAAQLVAVMVSNADLRNRGLPQ